MYKNKGFVNEEYFVQELNNKNVSQINSNLTNMLERIYGTLDSQEKVQCRLIDGFIKPDICITYKGVEKYVSIKSGGAHGVHEEQIKTLIPFFKECGMDEREINLFLKLFYRDGTLDGTGEKALDYIESRFEYQEDINEFNKSVNSKKELVEKVIHHCLFKGANADNIEADYIYFGTVKYGVICSQKQIKKHIERRTWDYMENPHIGPLQFRAHYYNEVRDSQFHQRRHQCDFWWARLREDLEYISDRYWG